MITADFVGTLTETFGSFLPRLAAALVLLIAGLIAIKIIAKILTKVLEAAGIDKLGERLGVSDIFGKLGLGASLSGLLVKLLRLVLIIVVVIIAVSVLGVESLDQTMNEALLFIPKALMALGIMLIAVMVGNWVRERVDRAAEQMDLKGPLGLLVEIAIIVTFGLVAAALIGIPTEIMVVVVAVVLSGVALALALGFGLGSSGVIRQISAGRYLSSTFDPGQRVSIGDVSGVIERLDSTACVVRTDDGRTLRIPNHQMLEEVVAVTDVPSAAPGA